MFDIMIIFQSHNQTSIWGMGGKPRSSDFLMFRSTSWQRLRHPHQAPSSQTDDRGGEGDIARVHYLMSEMYIPAPVVSMATPMPEIARQTNNSSKLDANPIPPTPIPRTPSPYVSSGFRPYLNWSPSQYTQPPSAPQNQPTLVASGGAR